MFFNAGCIEQVFCPKPCKKNWRRSVLSFEKNAKMMQFNFEKMTLPSRRLSYSNNQLTG